MVKGFGGKLGGRVPKGRKIGLWKRARKARGLKQTQMKLSQMQAKGVILTREVGISTTGVSDAVYLGHATFAKTQYLETIFSVLIKRIFAKVGVHFTSFSANAEMDVGDEMYLFYKNNQDDGTAEVPFVYAYAGPGTTYQNIVTSFITWFGTVAGNADRTFQRLVWFNNTTKRRAVLMLTNATLNIYVKSSMKLQNTTTSAAGTEADEVDNVPVNGKSYYGRGNGTTSYRDAFTEATMWATEDAAIIRKVGTIASGLAEMPPAGYFRNVKSVGKVRINPGLIKYSTLVDQVAVSFNWLMKHLNETNHTKDKQPIGQFRFFGFEHVVKAAADAPLLKIFGEINYQIGMVISEKLTTVTDQKVSNTFVTY